MKNVLVIQLFRRDAVLQSTPALAALRKARPDARIHVLARKPFGDALDGNPDADEVIEWDMDAPASCDGRTFDVAFRPRAQGRAAQGDLERGRNDRGREQAQRQSCDSAAHCPATGRSASWQRLTGAGARPGAPCWQPILAWPDSPGTARRLSELRESLRPLLEKRFDAVYNLSNETMGALVACLLKPRESAGLVLCRDRNYRVRDDMSAAAGGDWLRCLYVSGEVESPKLFNLADTLARACSGAEAPSPPRVAVSPADERYAEEVIRHCSPASRSTLTERDRLIVIQPGVSGGLAAPDGAEEDDARWPAPQWVALAGRLRRAGHGLLFLGDASDRADARTHGARSFMRLQLLAPSGAGEGVLRVTEEGRYCAPEPASVGQLVALLRRCRLLVSADTATAQAAAAAGTPCLFLASGSFAERDAWESGPSGEGHFVLEPKAGKTEGVRSLNAFKAPDPFLPDLDAALAAVECALSDGRDVPESLQGARAVLHRSGRMPDGFLGLRPLGRPALTLNDLLRLMLRTCLLRQRFAPLRSGGSWRPWLDEVFAWYSIGDRERLLDWAAQAAERFAMLRWIAQLGVQTASAPVPDSGRGSATQASQGWIERRILALEENETLRLLVALFRRSLLDTELLPSRQKAVVHRWNCHLLAEECGFMAQTLRDFARCADPGDANRASAKTRNRPWRPICMTPSGFPSSSYRR